MWRGTLAQFLKGVVAASAIAGCGSNTCLRSVPVVPDGGYQGGASVGQMLSASECAAVCNPAPVDCVVSSETDNDGSTQKIIYCDYETTVCHTGRRPAGLVAPRIAGSAVGAWLARAAHLEAAAVPAFERLAAELAAHRAPPSLVRAARRAAREERGHARTMSAFAVRFGAAVPPVVVTPPGVRRLAAIAHENAVEGCVGETWGALLAFYQAEAAADPALARAMAVIAEEESRHAELAWAVAQWADALLPVGEARVMRAARREAAARLRAQLGIEPDPSLRWIAGLPSAGAALGLFDRAARRLWS